MLADNIRSLQNQLEGKNCQLVAVSKTYPINVLEQAYQLGLRLFGENKVQEMTSKYEALPKDIQWHMIGHLQSNKVKYIAPFVALIHSVDSLSLLKEIDKQGKKNGRVIPCLLQVHIAKEETKFGFSFDEVNSLLSSPDLTHLQNIRIVGLMGMATNTENTHLVKSEFRSLKKLYDQCIPLKLPNCELTILSMGMSGDFLLAMEEGSNMIRVGSAIFGQRDYSV